MLESDPSEFIEKQKENTDFTRTGEFEVNNAYPNPFNPVTTVSFNVTKEQEVKVVIYDIIGRKIWERSKQSYLPGLHSFVWNGTNIAGKSVSSGVYIVNILTKDKNVSKKIMFMK
ncbi:T9SS type A sorting domain-containing protein [bacterium]|nr:T9SS type A sorting domain-containing protein [Candidatus Neomarinimicrobiota bacterium]MCK5685121.1 T9SS type A sorting domain-containing protein [bacterium]